MTSMVSCTISLPQSICLMIVHMFNDRLSTQSLVDLNNLGDDQEYSNLRVELNIKGNGRWVPTVELGHIRFTAELRTSV